MRRPKAPSASSGPAALERAEPAGRLEQPRRLELAALAGSARRGTSTFHASARCSSSPAGQRADAALDSTRTWSGAAVARPAPRRPREQQVAGRGRHAPRPPAAKTVGRPRRSGAASSTSSCTSVAEWTSSTAAAARTRRSSAPSRVRRPRGEQDQQRAQALAARGDRRAGVRGRAPRRGRRPARRGAPRAAPSAAGTCAPAASMTASDGFGGRHQAAACGRGGWR